MATDINREKLAKSFEQFVAFANINDILNAAMEEAHLAVHSNEKHSSLQPNPQFGGFSRRKTYEPDGTVIKVASIVVKTEAGKQERVYKREDMFVQDDLFQVLSYWMAQKRHAEKKDQVLQDIGKTQIRQCFRAAIANI